MRDITACECGIPVTTCFHHKDRETGRSCTRCDRPACAECLRDAAVGAHCWECIRAARPPTRERVRRWNASVGPMATKVLMGLNGLVFVLTSLQAGVAGRGGELQGDLVLFGPAVAAGEWYRLVTSGFVHFGLIHVGFNLVLLYRFGEMLEPALGRVRFVALYLGALVAGSCGALVVEPLAFTGGASGAVYGLLGAAALLLRRQGIGVWQGGLGGLLAVNLALTFVIPGISIGGHLGGLAGGTVLGAFMVRSSPSPWATVEGVAVALVVAAVAVLGAEWTV